MGINQFWFALPLIVSISLVYSATRHEAMRPIFIHAIRFGAWLVAIMAILAGIQAVMFRWT
jgi:hypothetical protein